MAELVPSLLTPRRPWRRAGLVAGGTAAAVTANVALVAWLLHPLVPAQVTVIEREPWRAAATTVCSAAPTCPAEASQAPAATPPVAPPPAPPAVASPPPVGSPFAVRACPPPRRDAPRITPPELDEAVTSVAASPSNAGWIAAWNDNHIYVSTDAGRTFSRVLDGPGTVTDVGFDCFGTVVAIRDEGVGLRSGADERWLSVPGTSLMVYWDLEGDTQREGRAAVVSGGPEVVIVGVHGDDPRPRIARSADLGGHWRYHDLDFHWETRPVYSRQREDGTVALSMASGDCAGDSEEIVTVGPGRSLGEGGGWFPRPGESVSYEGRPAGLPDGAVWAGRELARAGDALYRVRGGVARKLPVVAEADRYVADAAGRLWSVVCGQPVIAGKQPSGLTCPSDE